MASSPQRDCPRVIYKDLSVVIAPGQGRLSGLSLCWSLRFFLPATGGISL